MSKLVTVYGGSGFVGRYIVRRMAKRGWRVRVAVRRPNEALFVKPYGVPGQIEPVPCNIRDDASVRQAMRGAEIVVNCVGTFDRGGRNNFDAIQADGAARVARIAAEEGVQRLIHLSALSASDESSSRYARTKAEGERAVFGAFPQAVIMRPSVIFGTEDKFFNKFAGMSVYSPILLTPHANTRLQPVHVDDVAQAVMKAADGEAVPGIYELGGPETDTIRGLIRRILPIIGRRRAVMGMPAWLMRIPAFVLDAVSFVTRGLISNRIITNDQISMLERDNTVSEGAKGFAELGIKPAAMEAVLPEYLWRFRRSGQFAAIKASAENLKKV